MTRNSSRLTLHCLTVLALAATLLASASPPRFTFALPSNSQELTLAIDPAKSSVHWTLDTSLHTVHGTFQIKRGSLHVNPATGKATGEIVADARSGESGNNSRDKKMHKEILESTRFTEIIFRPDGFDGKIPTQGTANVTIHGTLTLHGADHEITVPVRAELGPNSWTGSGKFSVPYIQWGLKNPSNFLLKARPSVDIELDLKGALHATAQ
ncbi:MAG: hypothetical protein NVS9B4_08410 [Candidatus Acidiferrum sp.]